MEQNELQFSRTEPDKIINVVVDIGLHREGDDAPETDLPYSLGDAEKYAETLHDAVESENTRDLWYVSLQAENENHPDSFCIVVSKGFRHKPQEEIRIQCAYNPDEYGECLYVTLFDTAQNDWVFLFKAEIPADAEQGTFFDSTEMKTLYKTHILPLLRQLDGMKSYN